MMRLFAVLAVLSFVLAGIAFARAVIVADELLVMLTERLTACQQEKRAR